MAKRLFAIIGGYVLWSVLWLAYNLVLQKVGFLPADTAQPVSGLSAPLSLILGSVVISIITGWVAAAINGSGRGGAILLLALLLLCTGIFFEAQNWRLLPVWYHLIFLALIVPGVVLGARLRSR